MLKFDSDKAITFAPIFSFLYFSFLIALHVSAGILEKWTNFLITGIVLSALVLVVDLAVLIYQIKNKFDLPLPSGDRNKNLTKYTWFCYWLSILIHFFTGFVIFILFIPFFNSYPTSITECLIIVWCVPTCIIITVALVCYLFILPIVLLISVFRFVGCCLKNLG